MAGIEVPNDRTNKQRARGFCRNPECQEKKGELFTFDVENDGFDCPKCGADQPPMVGLFTLVHLLIRDPDGPIPGVGGIRYRSACEAHRDYLATPTNDEAFSADPDGINCPGCIAEADKLNLRKAAWRYNPGA